MAQRTVVLATILLIGLALLPGTAAEITSPAPSDDTIREKIATKLKGQVSLHLEQFELEVNSGLVRIRGTVASLAEITRLERLVGSTQGVRGLESSLQVRPSGSPEPVLEAEVRRRLDRRPQYRNFPVDVLASGTIVTLSGSVDRAIYRLEAAEIAGEIEGVTQIINNLTVANAAPADEESIRKRVQSVLLNPLSFGVVRDLQVTVTGARVTLKGSVLREFDRREAERLTRTVEGVEEVQNDLTIRPE